MSETYFEQLTNRQNPIVKCPSCGAEYDINESNCPYCGSANEFGQENAYMDHLEAIEDNLGKVGEYAGESVKKEVKGTLKLILIPALTLVAIILLIIAYKAVVSLYYTPKSIQKTLSWQAENFPTLDEMYENGDFEGMRGLIESLMHDDTFRSVEIYNWKHYSFYTAYSHYAFLKDTEEDVKEIDGYEERMRDFIFYEALELRYNNYDEMLKNHIINKTDYEYIKTYQEYAVDFMERHYGISDMESVSDKCRLDGPGLGFDLDKIKKVMKDYKWVD